MLRTRTIARHPMSLLVVCAVLAGTSCTRADPDRAAATTTTTTTNSPADAPVSPALAEEERLVVGDPTGPVWRSTASGAVARHQAFRHDDWPIDVVATVRELDAFQPLLGEIDRYTPDATIGNRVLYRFPQYDGIGERRWVEPDGRLWAVTFESASVTLPWTEPDWRTELTDLISSLRYDDGGFETDAPFQRSSLLGGASPRWSDAPLVWQNGDDAFMVSGYADRHLRIDELAGDPVDVRGHAGRLDGSRLVWRENADTVVVIGTSIAPLDEISQGDLSGQPWSTTPLDGDTALRIADQLRTVRPEVYHALPLRSSARGRATVIVRVAEGEPGSWIRSIDADGNVMTAPADSADGAAWPMGSARGPVRVWASDEPYGPRDVPGCAGTFDPTVGRPGTPQLVQVPAGCVVTR